MTADSRLELRRRAYEFRAQASALDKIAAAVADACRDAGFADSLIGEVQLCVDEACTNAIKHGLKEDPSQYFQVELASAVGELEIVIRESGVPFDPNAVAIPDPGASLAERNVGGLGIFFMRRLMDKVEYEFHEDGLKVLRMVKKSPAVKG